MSHLPEKGEMILAIVAMNARIIAATHRAEDESLMEDVGDLDFGPSGQLGGSAATTIRMVYGDLFDPGEVLALSHNMLREFISDLETGAASADSVVSLLLQGIGTGVLLERARWQA